MQLKPNSTDLNIKVNLVPNNYIEPLKSLNPSFTEATQGINELCFNMSPPNYIDP